MIIYIAFIKDNARYFYLKDRQGSIKAITNEGGDIVERYSYNAFGVMLISDANGNLLTQSAYANPYTYTGRRFDTETGLYYYRNRMYSAELGRFISEDPLGYVDGYNLYRYARNNPLRYTDPMGTTARSVDSSWQISSIFDSLSSGRRNSLLAPTLASNLEAQNSGANNPILPNTQRLIETGVEGRPGADQLEGAGRAFVNLLIGVANEALDNAPMARADRVRAEIRGEQSSVRPHVTPLSIPDDQLVGASVVELFTLGVLARTAIPTRTTSAATTTTVTTRATASSSVSILKSGDNFTTEIVKRNKPGRDGGQSQHIKEKVNGATTSTTHQVTLDGKVIHQHQDHIGKHGTVRRFSDELTGTKTINAPTTKDTMSGGPLGFPAKTPPPAHPSGL